MRRAAMVWLIAMSVAIVHPAAQEARQPPAQEGQDALDDSPQGILRPEVTRFVEPVYPTMAESARVSGTVIVGVAIDAEGRIQKAGIARSVPLLDDAALGAVRQWEFAPPVVDGKPVPTGVNVTVEFVLGAGGDVPVPSVPEPRPSWIPGDFAFDYRFSCRTGVPASIDLQQYAAGESVTADIGFGAQEIQAIYLRMFAAGAFAEDAMTWRHNPGLRTAPDGFVVQVFRPLPIMFSAARGPADMHYLDVRHYGAWRRIEWHEPDYDDRPESHEQLETIGQLIRDIVAQKPSVADLPADQRACLED